MTLLTALELSNNYPDSILIISREAPKRQVRCFLLYDARRRNPQAHA